MTLTPIRVSPLFIVDCPQQKEVLPFRRQTRSSSSSGPDSGFLKASHMESPQKKSLDLWRTNLQLRSQFINQGKALFEQAEREAKIDPKGAPTRPTLNAFQQLHEQYARTLLPLDRHNLSVLQNSSPHAMAAKLEKILQYALGAKGFIALKEYLRGKPDTLLKFVINQQKKLMSIVRSIGRQYGQNVKNTIELPLLAFPLALKQHSQKVASEGPLLLKMLMLQGFPAANQWIEKTWDKLSKIFPHLSPIQAEHIKLEALLLRTLSSKTALTLDILIKRLWKS